MSGLIKDVSTKNTKIDTVNYFFVKKAQDRYLKMVQNVKYFHPIQIGICPFINKTKSITAFPFNFYILPF